MPSESGGDNSQAASENEDAKINSESPSTSPGLKRHGEIDWRKWGMGAASMKLGLTEDRFRCKISRLKAASYQSEVYFREVSTINPGGARGKGSTKLVVAKRQLNLF